MHRRVDAGQNAVAWTQKVPLTSYPVLESPSTAGLAPYFTDWLAHPNYDDYWKQWSIEDHYSQIQVPVFSLGAWYDIFLGGTLRNYVRLKKEAGTEESRRGQKLMVYVGGHAGGWHERKVGEVDFGDKRPFDINDVMLSWYDGLLKAKPGSAANEKPVKIFVIGRKRNGARKTIGRWFAPRARNIICTRRERRTPRAEMARDHGSAWRGESRSIHLRSQRCGAHLGRPALLRPFSSGWTGPARSEQGGIAK